MPKTKDHHYFMLQAFKEAQKAYDKGEVPVGAVTVKDGKIIARAHNLKESKQNPSAHAEMLVIEKTAKKSEHKKNDTLFNTFFNTFFQKWTKGRAVEEHANEYQNGTTSPDAWCATKDGGDAVQQGPTA